MVGHAEGIEVRIQGGVGPPAEVELQTVAPGEGKSIIANRIGSWSCRNSISFTESRVSVGLYCRHIILKNLGISGKSNL